jgi:hypothetical protein
VSQGFRLEALISVHDRKGFSSGSLPLDSYFHERVTQDIKRRLSNCFVALDGSGVVAGFYTFAAASLPMMELPAQSSASSAKPQRPLR